MRDEIVVVTRSGIFRMQVHCSISIVGFSRFSAGKHRHRLFSDTNNGFYALNDSSETYAKRIGIVLYIIDLTTISLIAVANTIARLSS